MENRLLDIQDLEVRYGDIQALRGITMGVQKGSIVALVLKETLPTRDRSFGSVVSFRARPGYGRTMAKTASSTIKTSGTLGG